jgi:branched-chain amino acid transport system ATP-binding protein
VAEIVSNDRLLEVENLQASYGRIVALRDMSFHVNRGEIVALLGANGAGKSTTLNSIMGLVQDTRGKITFNGKNVLGRRTADIVRAGMTLVPEGRRVFPDLTVGENLRLGAASRRDRESVQETYEIVYDLFPILKERNGSNAGTLSGGMQQMLVIGRALMANPKLMLLDEPSLGLAPMIVDRIFELLARLPETGVTMLLVEQSIDNALDLADRAYVLRTGRLVISGTAEEIREQSDLRGAYLGGSD